MGNPETLSAEIAAQAPGMGTTETPWRRASETTALPPTADTASFDSACSSVAVNGTDAAVASRLPSATENIHPPIVTPLDTPVDAPLAITATSAVVAGHPPDKTAIQKMTLADVERAVLGDKLELVADATKPSGYTNVARVVKSGGVIRFEAYCTREGVRKRLGIYELAQQAALAVAYHVKATNNETKNRTMTATDS